MRLPPISPGYSWLSSHGCDGEGHGFVSIVVEWRTIVVTKRMSPAVLPPLKEALSLAFWYKRDLRPFLSTALDDAPLVGQLDWTDYKRNIVHQLVDALATNQSRYFEQLLNLCLSTAEIEDPSWLKRVEDGQRKYDEALQALRSLRTLVEPLRAERSQAEEAERRRREEYARAEVQRAIRVKLDELKALLYAITSQDPPARGYSLEKLLNQLFALFDIDTKAAFRIEGEQIDGAFTFEGTEFLLEAKWTRDKSSVSDLDAFTGKINRKLENTLGVYISINGFEKTAISTHSQNRPTLFLMDGSDLNAVLDDRIGLPELLTRKRQRAAHTGEIMISAYQLLS